MIKNPIILLKETVIKTSNLAQLADGELVNITKEDMQGATNIVSNLFYGLNIISLELSNSTRTIGSYITANSTLKNLIINGVIFSIMDKAFANSPNLETVTFTEDCFLETTGTNMFYACTQLKTVKLPNSLKGLGQWTFQACGSLTEITIPSRIEGIASKVFDGCNALTKITIDKPCTVASDVPILADTTMPKTTIVYVPDTTTQSLYQSATNWNAYTIKLKSELQ